MCGEQDWDAEFADVEEDTLAEEFGSALDETIRDRLARAGLDSAEVWRALHLQHLPESAAACLT